MVKQITPGSQRVPGLPIKDCAESCNSSVQRCTSSNSIDVTAKTFFESFYLVPGLSSFEHSDQVNCPCAPTFPPLTLHLFLDFCAIFFPEWPLDFFCHHDSSSNLAESRYPWQLTRKDPSCRGYRDLARLLGKSWWPKKWGAIRGKNMHENREIVVEWTVGGVGA